MEQFATEEQQVEAIKKFWKENGVSIIVGAVLGLGGLWGWRYYTDVQIANQEAASNAYQELVQSLESDTVGAQADSFVSANSDSGYALMASLIMAQQAAQNGELDTAAERLQFVSSNADDPAIKAVAAVRLARVQIEQGHLDAALATLEGVTDEAFSAVVDEVKGDVYVQQEQFDKARAAYSSALEDNAGNNLLKVKLDNLAVAANS
ncbi:YfgM family protein [Aestuariibacter salexigens]|uniref:YfgM family protein n=1 Tax=Aestuariibacter salexigens TaxID=226010 RepID=UPI0004109F20|nr:tetratricopeptide repeat protein [Aestuariibacter salexigens]